MTLWFRFLHFPVFRRVAVHEVGEVNRGLRGALVVRVHLTEVLAERVAYHRYGDNKVALIMLDKELGSRSK